MQTHKILTIILAVALVFGGGKTSAGDEAIRASEDPGPIKVTVSIPPHDWVLNRLMGGNKFAIQLLVPAGQSPHTFEPTPKDLVLMGQSKLFFRAGLPFEDRLIPMLAEQFPDLTVIDLREGIELRSMEAYGGHAHEKGRKDPHTWMAPRLMRIQAHTACAALVEANPSDSSFYRHNLAVVDSTLDDLISFVEQRFANVKYHTFFIYHPSLGYFANEFGLVQRAVELEGKAPGARQMAEILEPLTGDSVNTLFVDQQSTGTQVKAMMRSMGISVVEINPLADNYPGNLKRIADSIARSLKRGEVR